MVRRGLALGVFLALVAGCRGGQSFARIRVESSEPLSLQLLAVTVALGGHDSLPTEVAPPTMASEPANVVFSLQFDPDRSGTASVRVVASLVGGGSRTGQSSFEIVPGAVTQALVSLDGRGGDGGTDGGDAGIGGPPDGGDGGPDSGGGSRCENGVRDGNESDVDCGGSCPGCALGKTCGGASDCRSLACTDHVCTGWEPIGPWGGGIYSIAVDPQRRAVAYAAASGAIFGTSDGARSWTRLAAGLQPDEIVYALAVEPVNGLMVYARTERRLLVSKNGGTDWNEAALAVGAFGPDYPPASALVVAPTVPPTVYIGSDAGLFVSSDGGATGKRALAGIQITSLAVDPKSEKTVYAGTREMGIWRTSDGGGTWTTLTPKAGMAPGSVIVSGLVVTPTTPALVYAASGAGLFKYDTGNTMAGWKPEGDGTLPTSVAQVALDPLDPSHVYVAAHHDGAYRRTGGTWSSFSAGLNWVTDVVTIVPVPGSDVLYAASSWGVFRGTGAGMSWSLSSVGIATWTVDAIATDPVNADTVYVTARTRSYGGLLFRSSDGGKGWTPILQVDEPHSVVADKTMAGTTVHVGGLRPGGYRPAYAQSTDHGNTWSAPVEIDPNNMDASGYVGSIAPDPADVKRVFVAVGSGNGDSPGIYRSSDGGATFSLASSGLPKPTAGHSLPYCEPGAMQFDGGRSLYVAMCGVSRLPPGAMSWVSISSGSPGLASARTLTVSPSATGLFVVSDAGLFVCHDCAANSPTWKPLDALGGGSTGVYALLVHPKTDATLWAGSDSLIARSDSGGVGLHNWLSQKSVGRPVIALANKAGDPQTLYAGSDGRGVYKTISGGQ